jgi:hypothetical protein
LAVGKKITLLDDKEIPTANPHGRQGDKELVVGPGKNNHKKKPFTRIDLKKTVVELTQKITSCVSQNQFSENIAKISDVFEKYSSKISEIDTFIGKIRSCSQPTNNSALD